MKKLTSLWLLFWLLILTIPSFGQINTEPPVKIQYDLYTLLKDTLPPDTITGLSHIYHPLYKTFPVWFELGNEGLPAIPAKWTGIETVNTPHYLTSLNAYAADPRYLEFYETYGPYTLLFYSSGGQKDANGQVIQTRFARHFSKNLLVNINLDFISSPGFYLNQASTQSGFSFNAAYTKRRYSLKTGIENLSFKYGENGGIKDPDQWTPAGTKNLSVYLPSGASSTNWTIFRGRQDFNLVKNVPLDSLNTPVTSMEPDSLMASMLLETEAGSVIPPDTNKVLPPDDLTIEAKSTAPKLFHQYYWQTSKRLYKDKFASGGSFYDQNYLDPSAAADSVTFTHLNNRLGISKEFTLAEQFIMTLESGVLHDFSSWRSDDYFTQYQQLGLFAQVLGQIKSWKGSLQANIRLAGLGSGAYDLNFRIERKNSQQPLFLSAEMGSVLDLPPISFHIFSGNHDRWLQQMNMQAEQFVRLSSRHRPTGIRAEVSFHLISNWAYFDAQAIARQTDYSSTLLALQLQKHFIAGPFNSVNLVHVQYTPATEIPLPWAVASSTNYLHHDIHFPRTNGKLEIENGFDLRYISPYQGYAYQPSSGAFYLREGSSLGNYPYIDLFLNVRVKRTRVFVKWEHANGGYTGWGFFPVQNYPVKAQFLKYGVYWHFYD